MYSAALLPPVGPSRQFHPPNCTLRFDLIFPPPLIPLPPTTHLPFPTHPRQGPQNGAPEVCKSGVLPNLLCCGINSVRLIFWDQLLRLLSWYPPRSSPPACQTEVRGASWGPPETLILPNSIPEGWTLISRYEFLRP